MHKKEQEKNSFLIIVGERGSSVDRARDFWSGDHGIDPGSVRTLLTGWVDVSLM